MKKTKVQGLKTMINKKSTVVKEIKVALHKFYSNTFGDALSSILPLLAQRITRLYHCLIFIVLLCSPQERQ